MQRRVGFGEFYRVERPLENAVRYFSNAAHAAESIQLIRKTKVGSFWSERGTVVLRNNNQRLFLFRLRIFEPHRKPCLARVKLRFFLVYPIIVVIACI